MNIPPDESDLHAYVDGQLEGPQRAAVERYLALHPERAAQVQAWRQDAQRLRAALGGLPLPARNPALDPAALRASRAARTRRHAMLAASFVLCMGLGAAGGWQAHRWQVTTTAAAPMGDALEAYRLLVVERSARLDLVQDRQDDLQSWLARQVGPAVRLPDLRAAGFRPVGGRLFATERGAAAMVLYRDAVGRTISFYVRPPESARRMLAAGERVDGDLLTQYGSRDGFNYAVVGPAGNLGDGALAQALKQQI
ncbi:anti-sigma factor family protein [Burkholderia alba]|uniref:anti-sigma factor family protein n=1 Tax=Burkholderia alba TaxID=2683677 RepID=UPI002B059934|nr:anti-sigma factor [Burkholderia alba]